MGPFLFGIASSLLGFLVLHLINGQKNLESVLLLVSISGLLMMVITFWWKISMHASALAAAVTALSMVYGRVMLPAFLLVVLVSWSRVKLHRHTLAQVIAGSLVGVALSWLLLKSQGF
ncbi:phosphatase PAP2 family protein [Dictyobacter vulcani]|uniref:phosphatase PAP2 family protein n=1 Tax=Dictyobacter vulcani TaxID=2607529 RepID=UPI0013869A08|nr:phosphatase PAP2 family protein [Dictyobacter vulcani]